MARNVTRIARKLSQKAITGHTKEALREMCTDGLRHPLFTVIGTARGFRSGTTQYGDWQALTGEFEATNISDGEVHNGGRFFPPPYVVDLLMPALTAAGDNAAVEFALLIGVAPADNAFGFEYYADSYKDPGESEGMKRLRAMVPRPEEILSLTDQRKAE